MQTRSKNRKMPPNQTILQERQEINWIQELLNAPKPNYPFKKDKKLRFVRTVNTVAERGSTYCAGLSVYCHWKCAHEVEVIECVQQSRKYKKQERKKNELEM